MFALPALLKGAFLIEPHLSFSSLYLTSAAWQHSICFIRTLRVKSKPWKKQIGFFLSTSVGFGVLKSCEPYLETF